MTAAEWAQRLAKRSAAGDWASLTASECRELAALLRRIEAQDALLRRAEAALAEVVRFQENASYYTTAELATIAAASTTLAAIRQQREVQP